MLASWACERRRFVEKIQATYAISEHQALYFTGIFRDEYLNLHRSRSLADARHAIEDYNRARPHSTLGNLTPEEIDLAQSPIEEALASTNNLAVAQ